LARDRRFRLLLPITQCGLAAIFGGFGLWQRYAILNRPVFFEGQTLWNSTARFHVWPWPYKFAAIANIPAFLLGVLLSWFLNLRGRVCRSMWQTSQLSCLSRFSGTGLVLDLIDAGALPIGLLGSDYFSSC
jgi:hypothetical protein